MTQVSSSAADAIKESKKIKLRVLTLKKAFHKFRYFYSIYILVLMLYIYYYACSISPIQLFRKKDAC